MQYKILDLRNYDIDQINDILNTIEKHARKFLNHAGVHEELLQIEQIRLNPIKFFTLKVYTQRMIYVEKDLGYKVNVLDIIPICDKKGEVLKDIMGNEAYIGARCIYPSGKYMYQTFGRITRVTNETVYLTCDKLGEESGITKERFKKILLY